MINDSSVIQNIKISKWIYVYIYEAYQYENLLYQNILLRVVAGTETEENKKDLWKMILEVYGALRKCYTSDTYATICLNTYSKIQCIRSQKRFHRYLFIYNIHSRYFAG